MKECLNHIEVYQNVLTSDQCMFVRDRFKENPGRLAPDFEPLYYQLPLDMNCDPILSGPVKQTIRQYSFKHSYLLKTPNKWAVDRDANLQHYKPGMAYDGEHMETGYDVFCARRMLAWMIYLNTIKDGGGTRWLQQKVFANATEGMMVVWPAGWTHSHKGIVSNTEHKYIMTGWCSFIPQWQPSDGTPPPGMIQSKKSKGFK